MSYGKRSLKADQAEMKTRMRELIQDRKTWKGSKPEAKLLHKRKSGVKIKERQ